MNQLDQPDSLPMLERLLYATTSEANMYEILINNWNELVQALRLDSIQAKRKVRPAELLYQLILNILAGSPEHKQLGILAELQRVLLWFGDAVTQRMIKTLQGTLHNQVAFFLETYNTTGSTQQTDSLPTNNKRVLLDAVLDLIDAELALTLIPISIDEALVDKLVGLRLQPGIADQTLMLLCKIFDRLLRVIETKQQTKNKALKILLGQLDRQPEVALANILTFLLTSLIRHEVLSGELLGNSKLPEFIVWLISTTSNPAVQSDAFYLAGRTINEVPTVSPRMLKATFFNDIMLHYQTHFETIQIILDKVAQQIPEQEVDRMSEFFVKELKLQTYSPQGAVLFEIIADRVTPRKLLSFIEEELIDQVDALALQAIHHEDESTCQAVLRIIRRILATTSQHFPKQLHEMVEEKARLMAILRVQRNWLTHSVRDLWLTLR